MDASFMNVIRTYCFDRAVLAKYIVIYWRVEFDIFILVRRRVKYVSFPMTRFNYGAIGNFC